MEQITSKQLYDYMEKNGVTMSRLADLAGITRHQLSAYFNKTALVSGLKRHFTEVSVQPINEALPRLAEQIRNAQIRVTPEEAKPVRGREYYPVCVERIKEQLGPWLNLKVFMGRALDWSPSQFGNVMMSKNSRAHGNITADHILLLNQALRHLASDLENYELLPDDPGSSSSDSSSR